LESNQKKGFLGLDPKLARVRQLPSKVCVAVGDESQGAVARAPSCANSNFGLELAPSHPAGNARLVARQDGALGTDGAPGFASAPC